MRIRNNGVRCFDSPDVHALGFAPAVSLFVDCDTADEVDLLFGVLRDAGQVSMPLDTYPFAQRFAWLADRFGVSWQLSYRREG